MRFWRNINSKLPAKTVIFINKAVETGYTAKIQGIAERDPVMLLRREKGSRDIFLLALLSALED